MSDPDYTHLTPAERELAKAAKAATKGPYFWNSYSGIFTEAESNKMGPKPVAWVEDYNRYDETGSRSGGDEMQTEQGVSNALYFAAADPSTVLTLLTRLSAARGALMRYADECNWETIWSGEKRDQYGHEYVTGSKWTGGGEGPDVARAALEEASR
jgi:hypothetical protein